MRLLIQRVTEASVTIEGRVHSEIGKGLMVLVGIEEADTQEDIDWLTGKLLRLRIFDDEAGVMNLDVQQVGGDVGDGGEKHMGIRKWHRKTPVGIELWGMVLGMTGKGARSASKHCHPEERKRRKELTVSVPQSPVPAGRPERVYGRTGSPVKSHAPKVQTAFPRKCLRLRSLDCARDDRGGALGMTIHVVILRAMPEESPAGGRGCRPQRAKGHIFIIVPHFLQN